MQLGGEGVFYAAALSHASINLIEYYGTISASSERDNQISPPSRVRGRSRGPPESAPVVKPHNVTLASLLTSFLARRHHH